MSARRYPTAELYEERQRDFYGNGNRSERSYDELDIDIQRGAPRRSAPDFLRDDYGRTSAGALVVRERVEEPSRAPPRRREVEEDTVVIRGGRREERPREIERDDITIRRGGGERERPRPREVEETDITIKHRDSSRPKPREREVEREDITFRRGERPRGREVEREDITFTHSHRDKGGPPPWEVERDEVTFTRREESRHGRDREVEKDSLVIRSREKSLPPPRERGELVAREREELVVRRRPEPREREEIKEEIIIRRMEQRSPTPPPPPPPPPEPEPIIRPPIIQEVITHHRHIDHGFERARSPTPPPPPSPPSPVQEDIEISIRRQSRHGKTFNEDIIYERETLERKERDWEIERTRRRSLSPPKSVSMFSTSKSKSKDMWTEVTKDLVIKEAIDSMGYEYEETEMFFYVMEYLRYEDVLQLVELSDDIRRRREARIRQIEFEREEIRERRPKYDERGYDREVIYDSRRSRY